MSKVKTFTTFFEPRRGTWCIQLTAGGLETFTSKDAMVERTEQLMDEGYITLKDADKRLAWLKSEMKEAHQEYLKVKDRLEYLRAQLRAEAISYGELTELQSLADYIDKDDVELREAAGIPEFEENKQTRAERDEMFRVIAAGFFLSEDDIPAALEKMDSMEEKDIVFPLGGVDDPAPWDMVEHWPVEAILDGIDQIKDMLIKADSNGYD